MLRAIQLFTLHSMLVVAEERSFLAASRRLGMHCSALSRRVRDLELILGVTLFDRHPGGVRPTPIGLRFLANLRPALADLGDALSMVDASGRGKSGRLSIGLEAPLPGRGFLDSAVAFVSGRPGIDIHFTEAKRADLTARLGDRTIDIVIMPGGIQFGAAAVLPLWQDQIVVAISADSPLADRATIEQSQLGGQNILVNMESIDLALLARITAADDPPFIVRHDVSRVCLLKLVGQGLGVTLLSESDTFSGREGVVFARLQRGGRPVQVRHCAHWRPDNPNPVLAAFITFLREQIALS